MNLSADKEVTSPKQMKELVSHFADMPDRLLKYLEILLRGEDASPYCYQGTMSYRRLAIELTTHCNLNCIWCYRGDTNFQHILNRELPFQQLEKIISNTVGRFRMVHLGGLGEPLLYPKLGAAVEMVRKLSKQIKITTNGTLLTKKRLKRLVDSGLTHIEISIDAFTKEENDELRGSNLDELIEMVKYISAKNILHLQINSVVSDINYNSLKGVVKRLNQAENIDVLHLIPLFMTEQTRKKGIQRISDERFKALLAKLDSDIRKHGLEWRLSPSLYGQAADPIIEMKRKKNICFTCFEDPYISVKGELLPCGRQKVYGGVEADIGFEKAWNHPKLLSFRKNMLQGNYPRLCGDLCFLKSKRG